MKLAVLIFVAAAITAGYGCYEDCCYTDGDYYHDGSSGGTHQHYPPPAPDPVPPPCHDRYDVTFSVSALTFDLETDEIIGDVEILYSVDDGPFYSLGYSDYEAGWTPSWGDLPDALVNFGDPNDGPFINIGDIPEGGVAFLTLMADDPEFGEYYPRFIDLTIYNDPDGIRMVSEGAGIEIEMDEAGFIEPFFPVRALFDLEWKY